MHIPAASPCYPHEGAGVRNQAVSTPLPSLVCMCHHVQGGACGHGAVRGGAARHCRSACRQAQALSVHQHGRGSHSKVRTRVTSFPALCFCSLHPHTLYGESYFTALLWCPAPPPPVSHRRAYRARISRRIKLKMAVHEALWQRFAKRFQLYVCSVSLNPGAAPSASLEWGLSWMWAGAIGDGVLCHVHWILLDGL